MNKIMCVSLSLLLGLLLSHARAADSDTNAAPSAVTDGSMAAPLPAAAAPEAAAPETETAEQPAATEKDKAVGKKEEAKKE